MFKEASRHNWHLFSTVWVSKLICLQKCGERECLRVIVPPTTLRVLISGWAPSHPPPPAAFFDMTKSRGFFAFVFFPTLYSFKPQPLKIPSH